ncbi:RING finger protein 141-like isoform X2 [Coccinella septempunctata]|uniref:RING finger protein 141-like isoform X2 n=1 Tax=Coccinella septempunctata TaxID=41139 RepID=UPI001D06609E|nr:RING finger protein 141-like isoform X2 [Coccinella septempunctata]
MGQINSSNIQSLLPNIYSELFNKEPNALIAKEIKEMDREKFQEIISELNSFEKACITYEKIVSHADNDPVMSSECTICLERKVELTLPCAHSFCSQCIEEWSSEHHTCPICRDKLESTSDSWVLSEKPEADEISQELRSNLIRLTEEKKDSCTAS